MTMRTGPIQFEPATTLGDIHKTMSPEPLMTPSEIRAFYRILAISGRSTCCC
jgi:hypothetical protein